MSWDLKSPLSVAGLRVSLEPLTRDRFDEVCAAMLPDPDGWYAVMFGLNSREAYREIFDEAETYWRERSGMGLIIRDAASGAIAGISFYLKMDRTNRTVEIGTTNIAPRFRRTHVNTAAKLLMLQYAFEELRTVRVSFRVDEENLISRTAVERLGARYGGLLRYERILPDGRIRDYRFYSVIDSEWPAVKNDLTARLARP